MGRDIRDIRGRALKRTSKSAVGRALFKAKGGTVKKQLGGMTPPVGGATPPVGGATPAVGATPAAGGAHQGYNARLDESLGARHPGATGSMAGRRAMSQGMERSMGRGPYSGAATMAKHGGTIKKKKKK